MSKRLGLSLIVVCLLFAFAPLSARTESALPTAVVCPSGATFAEKLACKEVRRYVYLRTGTLLPIVDEPNSGSAALIIVGRKDRPTVQSLLADANLKAAIEPLAAEQYVLRTLRNNGRPVLLIAGGDDIGTLYGAYRFAEHLGVRFYLHGDVVPARKTTWELPALDETRKPLFDRRGILPFHDFPEGPDWWSRDGYKAILGQLPKMGMNFFGLHAYPESGVGPEPLVWIGAPAEIGPGGKVKASYPSRHFTTDNLYSSTYSTGSFPVVTGAWGYQPCKTSEYVFGAADLFDRDDYGADYMRGLGPWNKMSPEQCNVLFDRMGEFLGDVFTVAKRLGIKTCVGTETPLTIPTLVKERLKAAGQEPSNPVVVQELYEGLFQRIAKTHLLDYYWLWTPEVWTWEAVKQPQIDATMADFRAALAAANKVNAPFTLATCGWVLGPPQTPSLFDDFLPKNMPMSCINRDVGNTPVEPGFANIRGRPKWAIPWMEDDPGLTTPQLWVGRMRRDAFDALKYGCTGLLGIHWRTRILGPNVSALAKAAWDQEGWSERAKSVTASDGKNRYLPVSDFYADWAQAEFGPEAAEPLAALFARLDGCLPRPARWITGPGSIDPDDRPWEQVQKEYAFVDELSAMEPLISGPGNVERFNYWLNNFRCLRSIGKLRCQWALFNAALAKAKAEKDSQVQRRLAQELALPERKQLVADFAELHRHLLTVVTNPGEMGNVCNWQQQMLPVILTQPGQELAGLLGEDLPADALPSKCYTGTSRLFVPEIRTGIMAGETLKLTAIVLGPKPSSVELRWRPLGGGEFSRKPLTHVARSTYVVTLPNQTVKEDFEYYVSATVGSDTLVFPSTAPTLSQTVVVMTE